ncbi:ABC transporter substrate binding protein [Orrella marina]|nr:ABC transporter substrate binding protein [Orrella marina]
MNRIVQRIPTGMASVKRCLWRRAPWRSQRCQQQHEQWVARKILARGVARPDSAGAESVLWWCRQFMWLGVVLFFGTSTVLAQPVFVIGESKIASHAALDADQAGFVAGLADSGFEEGRNLRVIRTDANGSMQAARRIAKDFLDQGVDLLHTISTPSTLAGLEYQADIPIVFSSVTDPISAGIVVAPVSAQQGVRDIHIGTGGESSGRNLTGVSDLWPVDMQMRLYHSACSRRHRCGVPFTTRLNQTQCVTSRGCGPLR